MASVLPMSPVQDLKVVFQESTLVFQSDQQTQKKSIFLSSIDQIVNHNIPTVHFFTANPDFPPEVVAKRLKLALEKVLRPYDFMAGRLKLNQESSGRLEINCNMAGAGFVVASSEYSLGDLGDLFHPNPGFQQLAVQSLHNLGPDDDQPLCIFQVTSFKCGGFAVGMSMSHYLFDGISALTFIENLATQAFDDKPLAVIPCHNRHLLAARSPPHVDFPHPEFYKPDDPVSTAPVLDSKREEMDYKIFKLSSSAISFLKDKAKNNSSARNTNITSFSVVAALVWRCKALSNYEKDRVSTLLLAVDIRSRLNPQLPPSYCGNAAIVAYSSAKCQDLEKLHFSEVVKMVSEGPARVSDEYVKSVIDLLEIEKGVRPFGEYKVSSWVRMRFDEVVYPWGKPLHSGPVVTDRKDICWIYADSNDGINAVVSLPAKEMERFQACFHHFFP